MKVKDNKSDHKKTVDLNDMYICIGGREGGGGERERERERERCGGRDRQTDVDMQTTY